MSGDQLTPSDIRRPVDAVRCHCTGLATPCTTRNPFQMRLEV